MDVGSDQAPAKPNNEDNMSTKIPTTASEVGAEYAEQQFSEGCTEQVNIAQALNSTSDMPDGDYTWMVDNGIEPNAREYWNGYNARMADLTA